MSQERTIRTFKDANYFSHGTYKRQMRDYLHQIGFINAVVRTILAPLQRWRIIKQTQQFYPLRPVVFTSAVDYVKRIPKEQGITAFWKGNATGLWLYLMQSIMQVGLYDNIKEFSKKITAKDKPDNFFAAVSERIVIPIITSFCTQLITYPIDTARIRITMNYTKQKSQSPFVGIRTCLSHLKNEQNFTSIYKGFVLSNIISVINFNLFLAFASTASTIEFGDDIREFINADTISAVGALALIHPLDTLKKIIQLDNISSPSIFKNARDALAYIQKQSSNTALYNGIFVSMLKSFLFLPTFCLVYSAMDSSHKKVRQTNL